MSLSCHKVIFSTNGLTEFLITLDKDLPYTYLDEYVGKIEEVIEILKKNIKY